MFYKYKTVKKLFSNTRQKKIFSIPNYLNLNHQLHKIISNLIWEKVLRSFKKNMLKLITFFLIDLETVNNSGFDALSHGSDE